MDAYNELRIDGAETGRLRSLRGEETLGQLFRYEVEVDLLLPLPDLATLMGKTAFVVMRDNDGVERTVEGVVAEAELIAYDTEKGGGGRFVIRPHAYRQTLGRDSYASQDVTVLDVVKDVLADVPFPFRFDIGGSYPSYPYRVQYREDDWTYVSRIIEEEGIYTWFDHDAGSELVFADDSTSSPAITGIPLLPFVPKNALKADGTCVVEASFSSHASSHVFSGQSFDMKRPEHVIEARVGAGPHEVYDAPGGGSPDPAILHERMRVGLEGANAAKHGLDGLTTSVRVYPGRWFELTLHPVPTIDGQLFVTHVRIEGDWQRPAGTRFKAIRREVPFRPPRTTPEAKQAGLQMGVVVGPEGAEVHPDDTGRIRVQAHWDRLGHRNERSGTWMRVAQRGTPQSMLLPRMGWNVAFFNEEGGVDAPSTLCRIHDGDHLPEYKLPDNKTRTVYKTATTPGGGSHNEIYFEDKAGNEEMFVHASRDMHVRARQRKQETIHNDSLRQIGQNYVLHVDASMAERVVQNQTVTVGGNEDVTIHDKYSKAVSGNETRSIGGSRSLKCGEAHNETITGNRTLSIGAAQIDICLGQISTTAANQVTLVGGAVLRATAAGIVEDTTKLSIQTIGAARIDIAAKSRPVGVEKLLVETVGGTMFLKSNAQYRDSAETSSTWTVLGQLLADAPEVWAEAEEKIVIKCGQSTLTITTNEISLEADNLNLSGAHIDASTNKITHN